jgi:hypothetical protein
VERAGLYLKPMFNKQLEHIRVRDFPIIIADYAKTYKQRDPNERDILAVLKNKAKSLREIASLLKWSYNSLSWELNRKCLSNLHSVFAISQSSGADGINACINPVGD